jgi:hypothetical protein
MRTELENIADPGDRNCGVGLERPLLQTLGGIAENHMIDLGQREPGDLNRRIQQDQLFKLDLKRVKIPLSLFRQAMTASRRTRCSSTLKCSTRTHGTRSRPSCLASS